VTGVTAPAGLSLARVTVAAPKRRMDLALPDTMVVGELLPHLLRHAGEDLADEGELNGGWVLRRATGVPLDASRNLVVQGVRDGELLHLVHGRLEWPELAYDDVVEIIAGGARQTGRAWGKAATRRSGFAVAGAVFGLGLIALLLAGPPWLLPAVVGFGLAGCLTAVGVLLSRAFADATAGAVTAASGLPYAFLGGALLVAPGNAPLTDLGVPNLLLGSAALLLFSVLGHTGVAALQRLFMAGIGTSLAGIVAALLCLAGASPAGSAGVTLTIAIGMLPAYPLLASSMGRVPFPELPTRPEEILADPPMPRRTDVFASVARATELLTGMLLATAVVSAAAIAVLLLTDPSRPAIALAAAASAALLLRARLFPSLTQRVPLFASGTAGLGLLGLGISVQADSAGPRLLVLVAIVVAALLVLAAGLVYGRRSPSPYLGRLADIADVVAIIALIPLSSAVLGAFRLIQGLFASIGG
jgi:type VII secretion integral membrane protein EccD